MSSVSNLNTFSMPDYFVFGISLLLSITIGLYFARRGKATTLDYFLAGGNMSAWPVALSLIVTFESSIFLLGYPAEVYLHGFNFIFYNVGNVFALLFSLQFVPQLFHPLRIKSVYEYLSLRYGDRKLRMLAVGLKTINIVLYSGVVMFGASVALSSVTDIPEWASVLILTLTAMVYTTLGGMRAVIWVDAFQFLVMCCGILAILIKGTLKSGGVIEVLRINSLSGRLDLEFHPSPFIRHSFWTLSVGAGIRLIGMSFDTMTVQRLNSTRDVSEAKKVLRISIVGFVILQVLVMVEGLVAFAYFSCKECDPLRSGQIKNPNQIIPFLMLDLFGNLKGMSGLFMATLFSASLSTISSLNNSFATIMTQDLIKPNFPALSERRLTYIAAMGVVLAGTLGGCVAFLLGNVKGPLGQINQTISLVSIAPILGIFLLSVFCARASTFGVLLGALVSTCVSAWLSLGYYLSDTRLRTPWLPLGPIDNCPLPSDNGTTVRLNVNVTINTTDPTRLPQGIDWMYSISYQYFALISTILVIFFGFLSSLICNRVLPRSTANRDAEKYVISFNEVFLSWIPKLLRKLRYRRVAQNEVTLVPDVDIEL